MSMLMQASKESGSSRQDSQVQTEQMMQVCSDMMKTRPIAARHGKPNQKVRKAAHLVQSSSAVPRCQSYSP